MAESQHPTSRLSQPADSEPRLIVGQRIGRYVLLDMLGSGGMSVVYLAHDPELDRKVALKFMRVRIAAGGARRLQREAQALAKLSHPNVVPVYDVGMVDDQAFVAMEYVEGITLRKWLKENHSWREALRVIIDAGRGLAAAHARGLVHRDFKPDNVLIGNDGRVRVLDFGLVRLAGMLEEPTPTVPDGAGSSLPSTNDSEPSSREAFITRAGQFMGTPAYMAPEQRRGEAIDERADLFAFGITLYEALFKTRPYEIAPESMASGPPTVDDALDDTGFLKPRAPPRRSGVPRHIQRTVLKALAFDPRDRWHSVDAMLAELQRDPYRLWRRGGAIAAGVLATTGLALGAYRSSKDQATCRGGGALVAATWNDSVRNAVLTAFANTHLSYANDAALVVSSDLDAYTARLAMERDSACAATRLRGEQSEEVMDLRIVCYKDRLREVAAMVDLLRNPDKETVQQASRAAKSLSSLDECTDVAHLRATTPRPRDPQTATKVDELEGRLAAVKANRDVGKSGDATALAETLRQDAKPVLFMPLLARIDFWRGRAYADRQETAKSTSAFRTAFTEALTCHDDRVLKDAAVFLAQEYMLVRDQASFDFWAEAAQAAIDRGSPDRDAQDFLDITRCRAFYIAGKPISRLECLESYAAKMERTRPLDDRELNSLGAAACDAGELARGLEYTRRAYAQALQRNGELHPSTLRVRMYVCRALHFYGDSAGAVAECGATLKTLEAANDNPYLLGKVLIYLAEAFLDAKQYEEARASLARVRGLLTARFGDPGLLQDIENAEAEIDAKTGRIARALPHFRSALSVALKSATVPGEDPDVIQTKLDLGRALLTSGNVTEARTTLEDALKGAAHAEIGQTVRADLEFATARALWEADRTARGRAIELAHSAQIKYATGAPATRVFSEARVEMEEWLARHQ